MSHLYDICRNCDGESPAYENNAYCPHCGWDGREIVAEFLCDEPEEELEDV